MRISDWSADVCSSDPDQAQRLHRGARGVRRQFHRLHPILGQGEAEAHRRRAAARVVKPEAHPLDTIAAEVQLVLQAPDHHERSEENTSELQSLMRRSYAVFCLKKKNIKRKFHKECKKRKHTLQ